jgi:hypothetical protein
MLTSHITSLERLEHRTEPGAPGIGAHGISSTVERKVVRRATKHSTARPGELGIIEEPVAGINTAGKPGQAIRPRVEVTRDMKRGQIQVMLTRKLIQPRAEQGEASGHGAAPVDNTHRSGVVASQ